MDLATKAKYHFHHKLHLALCYTIKIFSVFLRTNYKEFQQGFLMFFCLANDITIVKTANYQTP